MFNDYPDINFHELNYNWVVKVLKNISENLERLEEFFDDDQPGTVDAAILKGLLEGTLATYRVPDYVTKLRNNAFYYMLNMSRIDIHDQLTAIGNGAFAYSGITNFNTGEGRTCRWMYYPVVPTECFVRCGFSDIWLYDGVTRIGNRAFQQCARVRSVTCNAIEPPIMGTNNLNTLNNLQVIYVPAESVNDYKAADLWSDYANIITAIV